jgi:hypothetical protein
MYELLQDLLSGRTAAANVQALVIVLDGRRLFSVSNRRLAVLKMFQSLQQHRGVRAPCLVFPASERRIAAKYQRALTTTVALGDGLGLLVHGREAWHMGGPLFRRAQEWYGLEDTDTDGGSFGRW